MRSVPVIALCTLAVLAAGLCDAQVPGTSDDVPFRPAPGDPGGGAGDAGVVVTPLRPSPPIPQAEPEAPRAVPARPSAPSPSASPPVPSPTFGPPRPAAAPTGPDIALVLPLNAPSYARAAEAVRAGFLAAAEAAGATRRCIVLPHGVDGVLTAFAAARQRGVRVIVGPLVRDDLKTLAISGGDWPTTIALNQLDDGAPLPPQVYSLPLSAESDARILAARALADGAKAATVIEGESPLMHRFAVAFTSTWTSRGGPAPTDYPLDPAPASLNDLRKSFTRDAPDAALLALDAERAALVRPYLSSVPAYASALLFERPGPAAARDLEGVRVTEIPWILTPDAPQLAALPRHDFGSDAETRLYALGLDAFRVALAFTPGLPDHLEIDGAIGHLTLGPDRQFERAAPLGIYHDGSLEVLDVVR